MKKIFLIIMICFSQVVFAHGSSHVEDSGTFTYKTVKPCLIKVNNQTLFNANAITKISIWHETTVIVHFGSSYIEISPQEQPENYIARLVDIVEKTCK